MTSYRGKRALLTIGLPLLVLSRPVQAVVAVALRQQMRSPVIFRHVRPGLGREPFDLRKFRRMRPVDLNRGWIDDGSRLTPFGRMLRASSRGRPSLWNVVLGDMSLVGPRPLLRQYLPLYTPIQAHRHEVKPGRTGLAQVSGRNARTWEQKFSLVVEYVDRPSLALDLILIGRTISSVIRREGISGHRDATMPIFMGYGPAGPPL